MPTCGLSILRPPFLVSILWTRIHPEFKNQTSNISTGRVQMDEEHHRLMTRGGRKPNVRICQDFRCCRRASSCLVHLGFANGSRAGNACCTCPCTCTGAEPAGCRRCLSCRSGRSGGARDERDNGAGNGNLPCRTCCPDCAQGHHAAMALHRQSGGDRPERHLYG